MSNGKALENFVVWTRTVFKRIKSDALQAATQKMYIMIKLLESRVLIYQSIINNNWLCIHMGYIDNETNLFYKINSNYIKLVEELFYLI